MKASTIIIACLVGLAVAAHRLRAEDVASQTRFPAELTDSTLREGVWIWRSGHHVPAMEIQKVVRIRKWKSKWDLTVFTLSHTRESFQMRQPPQVQTQGPYPISVTNGVLKIEQPQGVLNYSFRFYNDLLQFPSVIRTDARTFNYTVSEPSPRFEGKQDGVDTWSYTWTCSASPAEDLTGTANRVAQTPQGRETISCSYSVEGDHDGPALVFRHKVETRDGEDRFVWHLKYFGPQVYKSDVAQLGPSGEQRTYIPADESIKKQIPELIEQEPNKPDAGDGK